MIFDCAALGGPCSCGREHQIMTRKAIIEPGCIRNFEEYLGAEGFTGRRAAVYDTNTKGLVPPLRADREIVLDARGLRTTVEHGETLLKQLNEMEVLVAVGSGTVMDICRYCAWKLDIPLVVCATVASMDGFCANVLSILVDGQKKSLTAIAPSLVIADLDIIRSAPLRLSVAGVCDILAKYTSLADWRIARLVSGEYYCEKIADLAQKAAEEVLESCEGLLTGDLEAFEKMTYAQMLSGAAMQLIGNSRPASGAEHLVAHLLEMQPPGFPEDHLMHGEAVGIGTILTARKYHRLASMTPKAKAFVPLDEQTVRQQFGPLADGILDENRNDVLATFDPQRIVDHWEEIRAIIARIPSEAQYTDLYRRLGAPVSLADAGLDDSRWEEIFTMSAAVRNRLTLNRMCRVLDFA